jgi:hypothetical protein
LLSRLGSSAEAPHGKIPHSEASLERIRVRIGVVACIELPRDRLSLVGLSNLVPQDRCDWLVNLQSKAPLSRSHGASRSRVTYAYTILVSLVPTMFTRCCKEPCMNNSGPCDRHLMWLGGTSPHQRPHSHLFRFINDVLQRRDCLAYRETTRQRKAERQL